MTRDVIRSAERSEAQKNSEFKIQKILKNSEKIERALENFELELS